MKQYIGVKIVEAEPAKRYELVNDTVIIGESRGATRAEMKLIESAISCEEGYRVVYADGYKSWSPKEVFERAYLPIDVNEKLKTDKPSISQQMVDDFIDKVEVQTMGEKTTVVRATLRNGFEIVDASSCVSPENYSEELGKKICLERIKGKVWMLLGFLLQTGVSGVKK